MFNGKRVMALIPARGRNDGIEHMNMREFGGRPLMYFTVTLAQRCEFIDRVVVSTEDPSIAEYARALGVEVPMLRSSALADLDADMEDILRETVEYWESREAPFDYLLNLYPNAPFKSPELLQRFLERLESSGCDEVLPLFARQNFFWSLDASGELRLAFDAHRGSRRHAAIKYEELGGIYAHNLRRKKTKQPSEYSFGYCELSLKESRTITSIYDMLVLERLIRLPDSLINEILSFE